MPHEDDLPVEPGDEVGDGVDVVGARDGGAVRGGAPRRQAGQRDGVRQEAGGLEVGDDVVPRPRASQKPGTRTTCTGSPPRGAAPPEARSVLWCSVLCVMPSPSHRPGDTGLSP
ncbi:hypothetical protein BJF88_08720 [Cellulosimicrobium sp. CUA-896]|nr:hypothetical protein BJF88_08720 [Cellulosimicrobium sp. CUA-896]